MRNILSIILLFLTSLSHGATYYVKVAGGTGSGLDDANAWSYAKLNATTLTAGDNVFLKRGDRFFGALTVTTSGTSSNRITYGAYGTGALPVITGLTVIPSWAALGSNRYQATINSGARLNMVLVDSLQAIPARYPNPGAANEGYLTVDSHTPSGSATEGVTTNVITDASLSTAITWSMATGAEIAIVNNQFTRDAAQITAITTNTVSWTAVSTHVASDGFGYFIQNHPLALDQQNEYYYNSTAGTIQLYSATPPVNASVSTVETLLDLNNKSYLTFRDIQFIGADSMAFHFYGGSKYIDVINCQISYNGTEGLSTGMAETASHILVDGSSMNISNSYAILMYHCDSCTISNNVIKNSGMIPGLGKIGSGGYGSIGIQGTGNIIRSNRIDTVGGPGISFQGNTTLADSNYINNYCNVFADMAGIYTNGSGPGKIFNNIILNGSTKKAGTDSSIHPYGVYLDEGAHDIVCEGNTVINSASNAFYIHASYDNIIRRNSIFMCPTAIALQNDDGTGRGHGNKLYSNIMYNPGISNGLIYALDNDHVGLGTLISAMDSNYYFKPFNPAGYIRLDSPSVRQFYDVPGMTGAYGYEAHGQTGPSIPRYTNINAGSNTFPNSSFTSATTGVTGSDGNTVVTLDSKLDGNAVKISSTAPVTTDLNAIVTLGAMAAGQTKMIKLSSIGSENKANVRVLFMQGFYGGYFGDDYFIPLSSTRSENTFYVTADAAKSDVRMVLERRSPSTYWIDNVTFQDVTSFTTTNLSDSIRVEYNATRLPKNINLSGIYLDIKNNFYTGNINLAPYSSTILRKVADLPTGSTFRLKGNIKINE